MEAGRGIDLNWEKNHKVEGEVDWHGVGGNEVTSHENGGIETGNTTF